MNRPLPVDFVALLRIGPAFQAVSVHPPFHAPRSRLNGWVLSLRFSTFCFFFATSPFLCLPTLVAIMPPRMRFFPLSTEIGPGHSSWVGPFSPSFLNSYSIVADFMSMVLLFKGFSYGRFWINADPAPPDLASVRHVRTRLCLITPTVLLPPYPLNQWMQNPLQFSLTRIIAGALTFRNALHESLLMADCRLR